MHDDLEPAPSAGQMPNESSRHGAATSAISVVIPTYNRAVLLRRALESVLAQERPVAEIVVVDDGSSDDTRSVVAGFAAAEIRYVHQERAGVSAARNRGAGETRGEYVLFLDSDDLLLPDGLAALAAAARRRPELGLIGGGFRYIDEQERVIGEARPWEQSDRLDLARWMGDCPFIPSATLVRASWHRRIGGFEPVVEPVEDWDFWLRLAAVGCAMGWLEQPVCAYRRHGGERATGRVESVLEAEIRVLDRLFAQPSLEPPMRALRSTAYGLAHLRCAARQYQDGAIDPAKRSLLDANGRLGLPPERLLHTVLEIGRGPGGRADFGAVVLANLPGSLQRPDLGRRVEACRAAHQLFAAFRACDWPAVRRAWWTVVALDPRWLVNRGFLSIGLRSVLLARAPSPRSTAESGP